ncbi:MAG: winged-helix domain-containing protein [Suilimivivens sp.]
MEALSIINGVLNKEMHEKIEKFAFMDGFMTCDLEKLLSIFGQTGGRNVFLCIDVEGMEKLREDFAEILLMQYPVIVIPSCMQDIERIPCLYRQRYYMILYPFSQQIFRKYIRHHVAQQLLENRSMCFGKLLVDRHERRISINGRPLAVTGYEYEIFLALVEHMGEIVSREEISRHLPGRKRISLRNIDTHIKGIRKQEELRDMIQCVRSVGYGIAVDTFYRNFRKE